MKTFKNILSEVAQPKAGDEINFKAKHEIEMYDYPVDVDDQFTSDKEKSKPRRADYAKRDDMKVYEELDPVDKDAVKKPFRMRKDKDIDNDGDVDSTDRYLHTRRVAVTKAVQKMKEAAGLEEMRQPYVVIDTADDNRVVAMASDEKGAQRSINSSERPPMSINDKSTLKIVKTRKKQNMGSTLKEDLTEKAVSQSQQKLMGMALAYKRGEMDDASDEVKELANNMSEKDLEDFAKTRHKGLPDKVNEDAWKEVPMMTRQLAFVEYAAEEISDYLSMGVDPEEWFQNKLAHIHGQMQSLHAYIEGDKRMMGAKMKYSPMGENLDEATGSKTFFDVAKKLRNAGNDATSIASNASRERNVTKTIVDDLRDDIQALHNDFGYMINDLKKVRLDEEIDLDEVSFELAKRARDKGFDKMAKSIGTSKKTKYGTREYVPATDAEMKTAEKGARQAKMASRAMNRAFNKQRTGRYESVDLSEAFNSGNLKLKDGSTVTVSKQDAELLNQMMKDLNAKNRKEMEKIAMADEAGFEEILGFAREAL